MRRAALVAASLLAGGVLGAVIMLAVQSASSTQETTAPTSSSTVVVPPTTSTVPGTTQTTPASNATSTPTADQVLLVWTPSGLPPGFSASVADLEGVSAVTAVHGDLIHLTGSTGSDGQQIDTAPEGFTIPMELSAFDPATYTAFVPQQDSTTFSNLGPGQVILGSTSADLRQLGPGGTLTLEDGSTLAVAAVVPDVLIGAAEAAVVASEADRLGVDVERYLLIRYSGARTDVESSIRAELPEGLAVRIRAPGETPVLRQGDAVLPQVLIKDRFGEFAYRPDADATFVIEPGWVDANIVTTSVPILGEVSCHRNLLPALSGAIEELEQRNLDSLVDPDGFQGCFNPRYIGSGRGISRHAWGAAVDINIGTNPGGLESAQDPRLVEVMERWGFTSGHEWLIPDPGHFEYVQPPSPG